MPDNSWEKARRKDVSRRAVRQARWDRIDALRKGVAKKKKRAKRPCKKSKPGARVMERRVQCFRIAAGTSCLVRRPGETEWRRHTTKRDLTPERLAWSEEGSYGFMLDGWEAKFDKKLVVMVLA